MNSEKIQNLMVGVMVILLVFGGISFFFFNSGEIQSREEVVAGKTFEKDPSLQKYRSIELPEECRLPDYEEDLSWWKKHLSHHENTLFCLEDYYSS